MGCLPMERHAVSGACTEAYNSVARNFNAGVRDLVARLDAELGGRVVYGDVYSGVADVLVADPAVYGFEAVGVGCCGTTGRFEMGYMCNQAGLRAQTPASTRSGTPCTPRSTCTASSPRR
ncbi:hypothetical protein EJB05_52547, partial [Eragrostis curvula]